MGFQLVRARFGPFPGPGSASRFGKNCSSRRRRRIDPICARFGPDKELRRRSLGRRSWRCNLKGRILKEEDNTEMGLEYGMDGLRSYLLLRSLFDEDKYMEQVQRLKKEVKGLFEREMNQVAKLEFIDVVQRLGLGYHFDTEIKNALSSIYNNTEDAQLLDGLYATSLRFRLLRQHGYNVPQDVFQRFLNTTGTFKLNKDAKGLLGLYEASFHGLEGETILNEAWRFASKHLKDLNLNEVPTILASNVSHALDMPIHWRPNRLEARWFMDMYEK